MGKGLSGQAQTYRYLFHGMEFDEARFELRVEGVLRPLERKPLELLVLLLRHPDEVLTKDELIDHVWGGRATVENVLANAIAKLRKAMGPEHASCLVTLSRIGYRLAGPIERVATGRKILGRLSLKAGGPVPGRAHYVLAEWLAETAGNEVWRARHFKTGASRVFKFSADGSGLSALKREVTLFRLLEASLGPRPDLVMVHDWNFETPPFFLECEDGGDNLLVFAERIGGLAALPAEERLAMARRIIETVAASHEAGVLHKDIKPGNILISRDDKDRIVIKLSDFGSGGLIEQAALERMDLTPLGMTLTEQGGADALLSTPLYLAPEVLAGRMPTIKSDVYALGILLYQLLAGDLRKPLTSGWEEDISDPLLRQDIRDATAGDPERRLGTANELAQRLNSLDDRRRVARELELAAERSHRAERMVERMKARRPFILASTLLLAVGLLSSMMLYRSAELARMEARDHARDAETAKQFLRDVLANADPRNSDEGPPLSLRDALRHAGREIPERFSDMPAVAADLQETLGDIHFGLADFEDAILAWREAAEIWTRIEGAESRRALLARYRQARALAEASRFDAALALLSETDRRAASRTARDRDLAFHAALARGRVHLLKADIGPATEALERADALYGTLDLQDPVQLHQVRMDLSQAYSRIGRADDAVQILRTLQSRSFSDPAIGKARRASARLYLGAALLYAGHHEEAEAELLAVLPALEATYGPASHQLEEARGALGNLYASTGRWAEALSLVAAVRESQCARVGETHLACLMQIANEGIIRLQLGDADAALPQIEAARDGLARAMGEGSAGVQVMNYHLANALLAGARWQAASDLLQGLDPDAMALATPGETWHSRLDALAARILIRSGQHKAGRDGLARAIATMESEGFEESQIAPLRAELAGIR
ncbi:MAG: hypothetical protein Tsb008_01380 [Rhodothalassiaceae bacterium]